MSRNIGASTSGAEGKMAGDRGKRICVSAILPGIILIGTREAEKIISDMCVEGCPACKGAMQREGRLKCSCPSCGVTLELFPHSGAKN